MQLTSKKSSIDSLHRRGNGRIYETRTPEGEAAGVERQEQQHGGGGGEEEEASSLQWDTKGKGKAITPLENDEIGYKLSNSSNHSIASSEDDELLPSFGGEQDYDRPVAYRLKNDSSSSNNASSLGLHQNGFISRDNTLEREQDDRDNNDDHHLLSDNSEKRDGKHEAGNSKPTRKKKRNSKDKYNAGRFAKEMAFVVSFPYLACVRKCQAVTDTHSHTCLSIEDCA